MLEAFNSRIQTSVNSVSESRYGTLSFLIYVVSFLQINFSPLAGELMSLCVRRCGPLR
ncbi:hypothetical protein BDV09DRAFT_165671 [Aspergillus tetrazonus]